MAKFCMNCGAPLDEGTRFCVSCGTPVPSDQPVAEQPVYSQYQAEQPTIQPEQPMAYEPVQSQGAYQAYQPQQDTYQPQQDTYQPQQGAYQPQQNAYQPQQNAYQPQYQPTAYPTPEKKKSKTGLIIGIVVGGVVLLAAIVILLVVLLGNGGTDVPVPGSDGPSAPIGSDPVAPIGGGTVTEGAITVFSPDEFFGSDPISTNTVGNSIEVVYKLYSRHDLDNYIALVNAQGGVTVDRGSGDVAYTVTGGCTVEYVVSDSYTLTVRYPSNATYTTTTPPVTLEYLDNNSITGAQWLTLGAQYNSNGINYAGNTGSNLRVGTYVATQGNYLYYTDYTGNGEIYRVNMTTGEESPVVNTRTYGLDLNVAGDYLFYCTRATSEGNRNIYRANINEVSTEVEMFIADASDPHVYGDWIYFVDVVSDNYCRCRLDGSERTTLVSGRGYYTTVAYDKIYSCDVGGSTGLYACNLDGSDMQLVVAADCWGLSIHGGYVFYSTAPSSGGYIYRVDLDGGNQTLISTEATISNSENTTRIACDGDYIYFNSADNSLYAAPVTGEGAVKLVDDCVTVMCVESDSAFGLFYIDSELNMYRYDMDTESGVLWTVG